MDRRLAEGAIPGKCQNDGTKDALSKRNWGRICCKRDESQEVKFETERKETKYEKLELIKQGQNDNIINKMDVNERTGVCIKKLD
jgi:hypothetical protein